MRHLTISLYGVYIGRESQRLIVKDKDKIVGEYPISRLKTLQIASRGVSISSDVLYELSLRGVSVFFIDYRSIPVIALSGTQLHAVVELRKTQFKFSESNHVGDLCQKFILGKIKNQRAVLQYFGKSQKDEAKRTLLNKAILSLENIIFHLKNARWLSEPDWRERLMGVEGGSARIYWQVLKESELLPAKFQERKGRGAKDIVNVALNLGYSVLMSYVWNAVIKSGLEPYLGFFHEVRPGKPSLILDIMEEYRAWVVDRNMIKLKPLLEEETSLTPNLKKRIIEEIHKTFARKYYFFKKHLKLETILQRQVYRLCGHLYNKTKYKPILFKW
ncbi:MAG: CRISPR-associated endonuclease Cas1 [Leptonema sp. (in: bacteria)]